MATVRLNKVNRIKQGDVKDKQQTLAATLYDSKHISEVFVLFFALFRFLFHCSKWKPHELRVKCLARMFSIFSNVDAYVC